MRSAIFTLLILASFGPLAFVLWGIDHHPRRGCPACGHSGFVSGFGRFRCGCCGHRFILKYQGGTASTLLAALLPSFLLTATLFAIIISAAIRRHDYHEFWLLALILVQLALTTFMAAQTKKFPNAGAS